MPTVRLNRDVVEKVIGKKLSVEELKDRISLLGTDLDDITEHEIEVEIFPNRPDMLSEQGFSRALSSFVSGKTGLRHYEVKKSGEKVIIDKSVKDVRPYTACAIVKNLKLDDEKIKELVQMQEKLHVTYGRKRKKVAIGIYPMEKVKPPITFFADKPENIRFVPLEEDKEMNGREILTDTSTGRDYAHLLEGYEKFPFFKDSAGNVLSMPPVINSHDTGRINEKTEEVFIECSGHDLNILKRCLNMIVTTMADFGAEIYSMKLEYDKEEVTPNLEPGRMKMDIDYINKLLGLKLTENDLKELLERMGYGYDGDVLVPAYRTDILHQVDLAEDIAIAYGYENFEASMEIPQTTAKEHPMEVYKKKIREILVGVGMIECKSYHLINKEDCVENTLAPLKYIELSNPTSSEYSILRPWMIPSLLSIFRLNKTNDYPQKIFDIGRCFKKDDGEETGVKEFTRLGAAVCSRDAGYTEIKQVLDYLLRMMDIDYEIESTEHPSFIPGRVGRVKANGKKVAFIGEVHPQVLENFELEMPVALFELNLSDLFNF